MKQFIWRSKSWKKPIRPENHIRQAFEEQWKIENLENQIASCPQYDIFPLLQKHISREMKILEAGCGMGRWLFYFQRQGFDITGMDWSDKTVDLVKSYDPNIKIVNGDIRAMGFADGQFDMVMSLGAVEHDIDGPGRALAEFARVLKSDGLLLCTVPVLTGVRRVLQILKTPWRHIKSFLLTLKGKIRGTGFTSLKSVKKDCRARFSCSHGISEAGYFFFEYRFTLPQLRPLLESAGFEILDVFPAFPADGLFHDLGKVVGRWDFSNGQAVFNPFGRWLRKTFPRVFFHMAVCVARKREKEA
jgi:SAM-dependent methyltransferase